MTVTEPTTGEDFQAPKQGKKNSKKSLPRVYIGNLPLEANESSLGQALGVTIETLVTGPKNRHAFVTCGSQGEIDRLIADWHQREYQGKKLIVQRERKPSKPTGDSDRTNAKNFTGRATTFGGSSWSKPKKRQFSEAPPPVEEKSPTESISEILHEELSAADDAINATLASLAAVSFLAPMMNDEVEASEDPENNNTHPSDQESKEAQVGDFMSLCKKPLSELMADYGEEDPDWKAVQPVLLPTEPEEDAPPPKEAPTTTSAPENRLGRHGKAPIHVEFCSFGYVHGAPGAIRNGWSHAQPLPVLECRDLPPVPGHLCWRDGTNGFVQRSMPQAKEMGQSVVTPQVFRALLDAIQDGNHGYAAPLQMKIYLGSEAGRHRSVVACEQAAKELRKLLRNNEHNAIQVPVSVGTFHRDLERNKGQGAKKKVTADDDLE